MNYWEVFKKDFSKTYFDMIANPMVKNISKFSQDDFFGFPNIIFYGNDITLLKLYVDVILSRIFDCEIKKVKNSMDIMNNNNKYTCTYYSSAFHNEIDLDEIRNVEKQFLSEFIANHLSQIKNIHQQKHVVVLHQLSSLHNTTVYAMRKILESCSSNIIFIMTSKTISLLNDAILSRGALIRCQINPHDFESFLEYFINHHDIDIGENNEFEIDYNDGLVYNILKLTKPNQNNYFEKTIRDFLEEFCKQKDVYKAVNMAKSFSFKILHFTNRFADIVKVCLEFLSKHKKFEKHMYGIIVTAADLEIKSLNMSKPYILLERFLLEVFKSIE